jgi:WD40 repeat protein
MAALAEASSQLVPGFVFEGHRSWVWCVTSHEEGEGGPENLRLLTSSDDGYVCIWGDGTLRRLNHQDRVFCVKVFQDPEGLWLIASTGNLGFLKVSPTRGGMPARLQSQQIDPAQHHRIAKKTTTQ